MPSQWAASAESPDTVGPLATDWLARFDDPWLDALVAEALAYNANLNQTAARLDAALATADSAAASFWPAFTFSLDAIRSRTPANPPLVPDTTYASTLSANLTASWEVDVWGRVRDRARAAGAEADASAADFEGARLSIAAATARAWFTLLEARLQRELTERDVENRARVLRLVERRYASGLSASVDVRLSRSELAGRQATLQQRRQFERESARALELLMGRYPDASLGYDMPLPALPVLDGAGAPVELLARRPDLQAAERRLEAAGLRAEDARKALLPRLTVTGSLSNQQNEIADLFDTERMAGNLIAGLVQPLFQGGRLIADAQAARARAVDALYGYLNSALAAFQEVENALAAEALLAAREAALKVSLENAIAAERLTERDYAAGLTTIFNLLDAQSRRISAESALISVNRERLTNRIALYLAVAGPFGTRGAAPARVIDPPPLEPGEGLRP